MQINIPNIDVSVNNKENDDEFILLSPILIPEKK